MSHGFNEVRKQHVDPMFVELGVSFDIQISEHASERQYRHGSTSDKYISNEDIIKHTKSVLEDLCCYMMQNKIKAGSGKPIVMYFEDRDGAVELSMVAHVYYNWRNRFQYKIVIGTVLGGMLKVAPGQSVVRRNRYGYTKCYVMGSSEQTEQAEQK